MGGALLVFFVAFVMGNRHAPVGFTLFTLGLADSVFL